MAFQDQYFSGQGEIFVADRDSSGNILPYRSVGNVPSLKVSLETSVQDHKESITGNRLTDFRLITENKATVTMVLEKFTKKNLQLLMYGSDQSTNSTTTVTGEILKIGVTSVAVGDVYFTKHPNVSSVVVKAGSTTLSLNTDYSLSTTGGWGKITILTIANMGSSGNLTVDYSSAAYDSVVMFKAPNTERSIKFVGLNTADSSRVVNVELYRVIFDPAANVDLINDELAQFELTGSVLVDTTRVNDATLGGFGRVIQ
jgi:hypothetical protein